MALRPRSGASPRAFSRADLEAASATLLSRGGRRNPDVLLLERGGQRLVVKDFAPRGPLVRAFLGPRIAAREARAYQALGGHPAVPRFLGWIDPLAFAVEYRPGRRMSRSLAAALPAEFLPRLEAALREMHARGVAHLDLRHRSNLLLAEDGSPVLIDFGSAVCFRPGSLGARLLLPWLARIDLGALAKWRRKLAQGAQPGAGSGGASGSGRSASRPT